MPNFLFAGKGALALVQQVCGNLVQASVGKPAFSAAARQALAVTVRGYNQCSDQLRQENDHLAAELFKSQSELRISRRQIGHLQEMERERATLVGALYGRVNDLSQEVDRLKREIADLKGEDYVPEANDAHLRLGS